MGRAIRGERDAAVGEDECVLRVVALREEEQRRAFEPGYTTKRRGWGLGLALARRVVQDYHRGRIFIRQSAPGEGTTLVMSLRA